VVFQSKASRSGDAHAAETSVGRERAEYQVGDRRAGQTRAGGRVRGPRISDHVPGSARAGRTDRREPDRSSAGGVRPRSGETGHDAEDFESAGHG